MTPNSGCGGAVNELPKDFQIEGLDPIGIDNGFAMVVREQDARGKNLETLSDAAKVTEGWLLGVGYEFEQRADGLLALTKTYGLRWSARPKSMDLGLLYKALEQGQVNLISANATDGLLSKLDLKILRDKIRFAKRRAFARRWLSSPASSAMQPCRNSTTKWTENIAQ